MTNVREPSKHGIGNSSGQQAGTFEVTAEFADNLHIAAMLGEHDAHLALIEQHLGIDANPHGNMVVLRGPEASCLIAKEVLEHIYQRLVKGDSIGAGDIEGALRHAQHQKIDGPTMENVSSDGTSPKGGMQQISTRKKTITARTPAQSEYLGAMEKSDLVFSMGPAGTGKTYLAVAVAASYLERGIIDRIILSRPAVEAGERLGFLPGDMRDKVDPYLRPLYDALYDVLPPEKVERGIENGVIEIAPLAFMRGRTLANAFVILDEAQNTTGMQMKMFLTRLGEGSKMVVTGDPSQIDLPKGQSSGLKEAAQLLKSVDEISFIKFGAKDVVRRALVAKIVRAYDGTNA